MQHAVVLVFFDKHCLELPSFVAFFLIMFGPVQNFLLTLALCEEHNDIPGILCEMSDISLPARFMNQI